MTLPPPRPKGRILTRLWQASIWAKGAIPSDEHKYRNLKRVLLPGIDVCFVFAGWAAAVYGVPAISEFLPQWAISVFAVGLIIAAATCLLGVSIPKLWAVELIGKAVIVGLLSTYIIALLLLTQAGDPTRGFVLVIAFLASLTPLWRITLITAEWQDRKAHERAMKLLDGGL
jgi:hypothetical protein